MPVNRLFVTLCSTLAVLYAAASAQENAAIPDIADALLQAAYESGDATEIIAVKKAVVKVFPDHAGAIDAKVGAKIKEMTTPRTVANADSATPALPQNGLSGDLEKNNKTPRGLFSVEPWAGKITAGGNWASGNSDTLSVGFLLDAKKELDNFAHNIKAFVDLAESDQNGEETRVTTQRRWGLSYQLDLKLSDNTFAFTRASYENDQFSGYDFRLFGGGGIGHFIFNDDNFKWKIEGAPGYRYSPIDESGEIEQEFAGYSATEIDWTVNDRVTVEQDLNATWAASTTTFLSKTAFTTKLMDKLSTSLSFEYRYETDPPADRQNSDEIARASLTYGF